MNPLLPALAALVLAAGSAAAEPSIPEVDAIVAPKAGQDAPGFAVLVMRHGEVVHMKGYGVSDLDSGKPVDAQTVFDLASVSKQMTALAAAMVIADDAMSEETALADVLPVFAGGPAAQVTAGDLIRHTAGLADYLGGGEGLDYDGSTTNEQVLAWLANQDLTFAPGTRYEYSNSAYVALGSAVAAAAGTQDLRAFLKERVWDPLGMRRTGLVTVGPETDPASIAKGYKGQGPDFEASEWETSTQGDGSIKTTLADLALYEAALAANALVDAEAAGLFRNGVFADGRPLDDGEGSSSGYGYGWSLFEQNGASYATHGGSWMGTATQYRRNLTTGVTVIVLANGEDADAAGLAEEIEAALP